jgi:ABC-type bacteriocin/lantibiotic exporter with double-glycine peptidase domain
MKNKQTPKPSEDLLILQTKEYSCGHACLAMLTGQTEEDLLKEYTEAFNTQTLPIGAASYGLATTQVNPLFLRWIKGWKIVLVSLGGHDLHAYLVYTKDNEVISMWDPLMGYTEAVTDEGLGIPCMVLQLLNTEEK